MPEINRKNELLYRVYAVLLLFFLFALVIGYKVIDVAVIDGEEWKAKKDKRHIVLRPMKTQRGNIYADDGQSLLATSVEFFDIWMDPTVSKKEVFDNGIDGLALGLSEFSNKKSAEEWKLHLSEARRKGNQHVAIAKHVDHFGIEKLSALPLFKLGRYKGGFIKRPDYARERPYRDLAARTIGIDREERRVGLENSFHRLLRGEKREVLMKKVGNDVYIPVDDPTEFEIIKGKDLITTIDINIQDIVHNELLKGLEENQEAEAATAILMETSTGRIKAISNLARSKRTGKIGEYQNFAAASRSEPGSTLKAASVLALLEDDYGDSQSIVDFGGGKKKFYGLTMKDSGPHGIYKSTLKEALEKSSNIGIASAMDEAYNKTKEWSKYVNRLKQFGLFDKSGIELEGEPAPFIKDPKKDKASWSNTTIPWMAHGYELELTPLQVLRFYNAIANGGKLLDAQIVKAIADDGQIEKEFEPVVRKEQIAKPESIRELQVMLEGVVERGTGKRLKSSNYNFAGKTGTTKVGYGTDDPRYNASFAGYWPAEKPEYTMIVVVFGLRGDIYYGNQVAGPIFKRIMDWCYAIDDDELLAEVVPEDFRGDYNGKVYGFGGDYADIFSDIKIRYQQAGRWIKGQSGQEGEVLNGKAKIKANVVPDLKGMGLRDAVYVLENLGMTVETEGFGKVNRQSIPPGRKIRDNEIVLFLN